ncbi:hypothetical protein K461DRAFT_297789 [Myriangium duriaei CBS 260.36]|uniref:Uncharacterized protein n=1 Tax=Myriangium duriaei CBS 260.36 TaxID=1168546 RepID=A0A9P4MFX1_9PEZI|nr:hypothetical protein K461DRAFT_297789 [Myriangium duriaei CBS 260.36]
MTDGGAPLFTAVASSPRQLHHLLNTISFAPRVQVRITSEGIRFAAAETGVLEASIFLSRPLFLTYRLSSPPTTSPTSSPPTTIFTLPLPPLLSTLQILASASAPDVPLRSSSSEPYSSLSHRLARHANAFSASVLGTQGQCRIVYRADSARLELSVPETGGVRTGSSLTTYLEDEGREEIPFDREGVRCKAILPASVLGDAVGDIAALGPPEVFVVEGGGEEKWLVLRGEGGAGGECRVEFGEEEGGGRTKLLETWQCAGRVVGRYAFGTVRKALVAMRAGTKVSLRIDGQGVLSLQFLVEVGEGGEEKGREEVAFVDFRIVPLFDGAEEGEEEGSEDEED